MLKVFARAHLLRTGSGVFAIKIAAAGLGFINGVLLARILGPAEFGKYSLALSVITFSSMVAGLGFPILATREVATRAASGEWERLSSFLYSAQRLTIASTAAMSGAVALAFSFGELSVMGSAAVLVLGCLMVGVLALNQLRAAILRGLQRVVLADIPDLLARPVVILALLAGIVITGSSATSVHALAVQLAGSVVALSLGAYWLKKYRPRALKAAVPDKHGVRSISRAVPFLSASLVASLEGQISLYILSYLGTPHQVGILQAATQIVNLISLGLVAINLPLQPSLAVAWSTGQRDQAQALLRDSCKWGVLISALPALLIFALPGLALKLYGTAFLDSAPSLRILAIGQMFNAAAGSCGVLLLVTGHQRVVVLGSLISLVVNTVASLLTVKTYGAVGSAFSITLSMIFWNAFYAAYAIKKLSLHTSIFCLLRRRDLRHAVTRQKGAA
jgi:O-antigen/teichoic acid export membrane protein